MNPSPWRYALFVLLGMFLMYIVLKILSNRVAEPTKTSTTQLVQLMTTPEVSNMLKTNEAREVIKTPEFREFIHTLAKEQITAISKSLIQYEPK